MAKVKTVPAPTGGWNARDALADMDPLDAVILDNWFPGEGSVDIRKGTTSHVTTLGGWVETLAVYHDGATEKLLAGANGNIWNATTTNTSLASGFTVNAWQTATLDGTMGWVNGTDSPQKFNGTSISAMTLTGPTATNVIGVYVFKSRSYFWEDDSQSFWYSALNTMGATLTEFKLGQVGNITGELMAMTSWTRDGGEGIDDLAVFIFSEGDVVIYQGSDPGDSANWSMIGVFRIGEPVGRRCALKFGGDVIVITGDGYVSLQEVIRQRKPSVSRKIQNAVSKAVVLGKTLLGWEAVQFAAGRMLVINVPVSSTLSCQHIMNLNTGAWCRFTGWNARSFVVFNDLLYFGGNATIFQALKGNADNGTAIAADAVPAFNYLKSPNIKQITAVQPFLTSVGKVNLGIIVEKDFAISDRPTPNLTTGTNTSAWGSAWGSPWSRSPKTLSPFKTVTTVGRAVSARMTANINSRDIFWFSTTYFYEIGGPI